MLRKVSDGWDDLCKLSHRFRVVERTLEPKKFEPIKFCKQQRESKLLAVDYQKMWCYM